MNTTESLNTAAALADRGDLAGALSLYEAVYAHCVALNELNSRRRGSAYNSAETLRSVLAGTHPAAYPVTYYDGRGVPHGFDTALSAAIVGAETSYNVNGEGA